MHVTPLRKLYRFRATNRIGKRVSVTHSARSQEEAEAILRAWGYSSPKLQSTTSLRGSQQSHEALHKALEDPLVGPDWLPHLWAIPAAVTFTPGAPKPVIIRFANSSDAPDEPLPHIRIQALAHGGVAVGVGPAHHLTALDPDVGDLLGQMNWKPPVKRYFPDFRRHFGAGWNTTYCLHQAIRALTIATDVTPEDWFTIDGAALQGTEALDVFDQRTQGNTHMLRVPPGGAAPGVAVRAVDEPIYRLPESTPPRSPSGSPASAGHPTPRNTVSSHQEESEKSPMPDNTYTALLLIVDRSGSMKKIQDDMVGGLQNLLHEQQALPGRLTVDVVAFDNQMDFTHKMAAPEDVSVSIEPRGSTALHDAIGFAVTDFASRVDALPEQARPQTIQVVVVTDGQENASREYSADQIRELITAKQADERWDFVFLGANQDAVLTGGRLGFRDDAAMTFSASSDEVTHMTSSMSRYLHDRRRGSRQGFTSDERSRSDRGE